MTASRAQGTGAEEAGAQAQLFVINLCSSTSPMALSHPSSPELKRYTFFVSRQREEGRERFRLHMGYFPTQEEAEALLSAVRDVYPAAWAGPAPTSGVARRGRIAPVKLAANVAQPSAAPAPAPAPAAVTAPVAVAAPAPRAPETRLADPMSNVRDVIAKLSDASPAEAAPPAAKPAPPVVKSPAATAAPRSAPAAELSPRDTLDVLEQLTAAPPSKPPRPSQFEGLENEPEVRVVTPEDTQTLTDIRLDAQNNAPPCFAVQLVWSVSPIEVDALPHLAIFDAYTLYNVEGNRQGRKWYGLRLGFFSDPNSASQVANYVRSDYRAVAIVPVATKERDRARGTASQETKPPPRLGEIAAPLKPEDTAAVQREDMDGFELLAEDRPAPPKRDIGDSAGGPVPAKVPVAKPIAPAAAARKVPEAKPAGKPVAKPGARPAGKRAVARRKPDVLIKGTAPGSPAVLESTLEILGASTLSLDDKGHEIITDRAAQKPAAGAKKSAGGNKFSRLLSRLSGG